MKLQNKDCLLLTAIKQTKKGYHSYFVSADGLSFTLISKGFIPLKEKITKTGKKINVIFINEVDVRTIKSEVNGKYNNMAFLGFEKQVEENKDTSQGEQK